MNRLKDKVIVVTGAAMGQGAAEAELFASEGAKVVAGDIAMEQLEETVAKINASYPDSAIAVKLDISCGEDWDAAVKTAVEKYGKVNGLMNNAGLGCKGVPWDKTDYELLKKMIDVNLWGQLRGIQTVVPEMRKVGGGSIICVSSVAAYVGGFFNAYALAKGGVRSLSRSASVTLGKDNIRVNTIVPGTIETPMTSGMFSMKRYWKENAAELLLCFLMSASLAINVFAGYDSPDPLTANYVAIGVVTAVCMLLLFLAGYNRTTALSGIFGGAVLLFAAVAVFRSTGVLGGIEHIDDSPALFWLVTVLSSCVCYLLCRTRIGIVLLFLGGAVMTAAFCFLEYPVRLPAYLVFMLTVAVLFLRRVYQNALLKSDTGIVQSQRYTVQAVIVTVCIMVISGVLYYGIIQPMDPPTEELKLITKLQSLEIVEKLGISQKTEIPLEELTTQNRNDTMLTVQNQTEEPETHTPQQTADQREQTQIMQHSATVLAQAIAYTGHHSKRMLLFICLACVLIAIPFAVKRLLRNRWEKHVLDAPPTERSMMLFRYLISRLRYAGFQKPDSVTMQEYVQSNAGALEPFAVGGTDFLTLTKSYQKVYYGIQTLEESEAEEFWKVYCDFRRNLRREIGRGKYMLHYFSI